MGVGFTMALLCMGGIRELLGSGTLLGFSDYGRCDSTNDDHAAAARRVLRLRYAGDAGE